MVVYRSYNSIVTSIMSITIATVTMVYIIFAQNFIKPYTGRD